MGHTVFVTGGTGYIRRAVIPELLRRGHRVRVALTTLGTVVRAITTAVEHPAPAGARIWDVQAMRVAAKGRLPVQRPGAA